MGMLGGYIPCIQNGYLGVLTLVPPILPSANECLQFSGKREQQVYGKPRKLEWLEQPEQAEIRSLKRQYGLYVHAP